MSTLNGILGAINNVHTVRDWRVGLTSNLQDFVASNTKRMTGNVSGNQDWSGSFSCYGGLPCVMPGETFTFLGSYDGVKGCSGDALIDDIEITIDIEGSRPIAYTANFSGNGPLNTGADAAVTDTEDPAIFPSMEGLIKIDTAGGKGAGAAIDHVRTVVLRISCSNVAYTSSSTAGWVERKVGNYLVSVTYTAYASSNVLANLQALNGLNRIIIPIGSNNWDLDAVRWEDATDIVVDIENAAMVGFSQTGRFTGYWDGGANEGYIKLPDGENTQWWPADA